MLTSVLQGILIDPSWSFVSSLLWSIVSLIDTYFHHRIKLNPYNSIDTIAIGIVLKFELPKFEHRQCSNLGSRYLKGQCRQRHQIQRFQNYPVLIWHQFFQSTGVYFRTNTVFSTLYMDKSFSVLVQFSLKNYLLFIHISTELFKLFGVVNKGRFVTLKYFFFVG